MVEHLERVKRVEELGFGARWIRDIPLTLPSLGDAGQTFDPFAYRGFLAGQTHSITLGISSIALPLHHPLHVAKSAATVDQLSQGRLVLGVASGDRPEEYPAMGIDFEHRGLLFREAFDYLRKAKSSFPTHKSPSFGSLEGRGDVLPKPVGSKLPLLVTGSSRQTLEWNASNADGWMNYPRNIFLQKQVLKEWREVIDQIHEHDKPFMQPLYIILEENPDFKPQPIPLGFRIGTNRLIEYLQQLQDIGVNHVALNLRFNTSSIPKSLEALASTVLPIFHKTSEEVPI